MGRIFLFLMKSTDVQVGCLWNTSWPGRRACCSFFAHMCFALLMSVAWCNLFKINSHLKMLGSCWVKVLGRWCKVGSGGPAQWSLVKGGHLLGPGPTPRAKSQRRDLGYSSAGTVLREMVRDFRGANSDLKSQFVKSKAFCRLHWDFSNNIPNTVKSGEASKLQKVFTFI